MVMLMNIKSQLILCMYLYNHSPEQNLEYFQLSSSLVPLSISLTWRVTSFFYRFLKFRGTQITKFFLSILFSKKTK